MRIILPLPVLIKGKKPRIIEFVFTDGQDTSAAERNREFKKTPTASRRKGYYHCCNWH